MGKGYQLGLKGLEFEDAVLGNFFFAVLPDHGVGEEALRRTARFCYATDSRYTLLDVDRLHISLCGLGQYLGIPKGLLRFAREAAEVMRSQKFDASFDCTLSFSGRGDGWYPFVFCDSKGSTGLRSLRDELGERMISAGLGKSWAGSFTPHLTLCYANRVFSERSVEPISWVVREFSLIRSLVGRSTYQILGTWRLH